MVAFWSRVTGHVMLMRILLAPLVLAAMVISPMASAATAESCPQGTTNVNSNGGVVCVAVKDPGSTGSGPGAVVHQRADHHGPVGCFKHGGKKVPCNTDLGVWFPGHQCYAQPSPAPAGSAAWQGHANGSVWTCSTCAVRGNASACQANVVWVPPGNRPGPPDPGRLAQDAIGSLRLATAEVHMAPQAPAHSYVGVENWLWVPRAQWATLSKTVTAGATSVTVTAKPARVVWSMGPASRTCYDPGRVWRDGMGDAATTSCGYTYAVTSDTAPGRAFTVRARIGYQVDWVCNGWCLKGAGTLGLVQAPAGNGSLRVLQRQTVVVQ